MRLKKKVGAGRERGSGQVPEHADHRVLDALSPLLQQAGDPHEPRDLRVRPDSWLRAKGLFLSLTGRSRISTSRRLRRLNSALPKKLDIAAALQHLKKVVLLP